MERLKKSTPLPTPLFFVFIWYQLKLTKTTKSPNYGIIAFKVIQIETIRNKKSPPSRRTILLFQSKS